MSCSVGSLLAGNAAGTWVTIGGRPRLYFPEGTSEMSGGTAEAVSESREAPVRKKTTDKLGTGGGSVAKVWVAIEHCISGV